MDPISNPCSNCGAAAGERCKTPSGRYRRSGSYCGGRMRSESSKPTLAEAHESDARKEYFLDPDYRERGNYEPDPSKSCVRCQQMVDPKNALKVSVDYERMMVWLDEAGESLIGKDCWKGIANEDFLERSK